MMQFGDPCLPERFWVKVYPEPNTGCWLWGAARHDTMPYGIWNVDGRGKMGRAHVSTFVAAGGLLQSGEVVRHDCDQPPCVNPDHLRSGTQSDNIWDTVRRGRYNHGRTAKIDLNTARLIRQRVASGEKRADLARELGMTPSAISMIVSGRRWKEPTWQGNR